MMAAAAITMLSASVGAAADMVPPVFGDDTDLAQAAPAPEPRIDPAELECMAKVVRHEAGNQPRDGKLAVAQTLMNRLAMHRFGGTICGVVNQHGQFFSTASYNPDRDAAMWTDAVEVSRAVLSGSADAVAPGAMFFRAARGPANSFFRSRQQVASIGDNVFYR